MSNPNDIQYGGDHYKRAGEAQHWDMLPTLGFGWEYYIGCATKYLTRIKDEQNDPLKSCHFIDKLLWLVKNGRLPSRFLTAQGKRLHMDAGTTPYTMRMDVESYLTHTYFPANGIDAGSIEARIITALMQSQDYESLVGVRALYGEMLGEPDAAEATAAYVQQDAATRLGKAMTSGSAAALRGVTVHGEVGGNVAVAEAGQPDTVQVQGDTAQAPVTTADAATPGATPADVASPANLVQDSPAYSAPVTTPMQVSNPQEVPNARKGKTAPKGKRVSEGGQG